MNNFSVALFMHIMKMTLTQFLYNFHTKIFDKHWGEIKIRFDIFLEVFEVGDHNVWVVTSLFGRRDNTNQRELTTKKDSHQPQWVVNIHGIPRIQCLHENGSFFLLQMNILAYRVLSNSKLRLKPRSWLCFTHKICQMRMHAL